MNHDDPLTQMPMWSKKIIEHNNQIVCVAGIRYARAYQHDYEFGNSARTSEYGGKIVFTYENGQSVTLWISPDSDVKDVYNFIWKEITS